MAYVGLNTGTAANAGDGSTLRAGGNIVNANFKEIYNYFGDGSTLSFSGGNWIDVATGINTLSYVGIGTTNPTDALTVRGGGNVTGVLTANTFSGIVSFTDFTVSVGATFNGNVMVGAGITAYASSGIISATKYYGDGSTLLSVPSGLGTALSDDTTSPLNKMYYVDANLSIGQTVTVDPPASSQVAFTNYPNILVDGTHDLIVADGDDFIPDILGIGTTGIGGVLSGSGGRVRADNYTNRTGGAPTFPQGVTLSGISTISRGLLTDLNVSGVTTSTAIKVGSAVTANASGINVTGVVTATTFVGALTGNVTGNASGSSGSCTGNAAGLTGTPNITVGSVNATSAVISADAQVGGALTVTGNFTVDGTQTIINTSSLEVEDKTVGIASTASPTNTTANGAGIQVYGATDKTLLWQNQSGCFEFNQPLRPKGVNETVAAATTYADASGNIVLELDMSAASTYTYNLPAVWSSGRGANIGIVSFKNVPGDSQNGQTVTVITTQLGTHGGGTGYANTHDAVGFGATCTIIPIEDGSAIAGIQTAGRSAGTGLSPNTGITTVTLSPAALAVDFVSFFVHFDGNNPATLTSYKVYVTKNGGFGFGSVGI